MKKELLNEKIKEATKDSDIKALIKSVTNRFRNKLTEDELNSCALNALSRAIAHYDPQKKSKFTTYLHNGLKVECLTQLKKNEPTNRKLHRHRVEADNSFEIKKMMIDVMDEISQLKDGHMLVDKYLWNYSLREIGIKNGIHPETVRLKIKNTLETLRYKMR